MSASSLVILAALVFKISCGKIDRQRDKETNAAENPTHATSVGVGNSDNDNDNNNNNNLNKCEIIVDDPTSIPDS